jgi:hypothetical protein
MDSWSPDQLKRMQLGGNDALNNFFQKYGVEKTVDIKEKYNTKAAEVRLSAIWFKRRCLRDLPFDYPGTGCCPVVQIALGTLLMLSKAPLFSDLTCVERNFAYLP